MTFAGAAFALARPLLHRLPPERAHAATLAALRVLPRVKAQTHDVSLRTRLCGLDFPNPLGLAAGFDKNADAPDALLGLGFGFVEIGSVTLLPQPGNPRPRLFRLAADRAIVNRLGFNSAGHRAVHEKLARRRRDGIAGVNIGANLDSPDRIGDYVEGMKRFADIADYVAVNISSPNTPGLRDLQAEAELQRLLDRLHDARLSVSKQVPLFLKIAPDLADAEIAAIARVCRGGGVDAVIVSNTTIARPPLLSRHGAESGGLSGEPLFFSSTQVLARLYLASEGTVPLIGCGGVADADTAWAKIEAGASLLQLYTALVYQGPYLIRAILDGLVEALHSRGHASLDQAVGRGAEQWATTD